MSALFDVSVFGTDESPGNTAGVVLDADGLTDREMRGIAKDACHSETAFVLRPDGNDHDVRLRFFTPTTEVPACGHATIAAHYVRAHTLQLRSGTVAQKTLAGRFQVDVERGTRDYQITLVQHRVAFGAMLDRSRQRRVREALGIDSSACDLRCPMQIVSTGHSKVMIGIRDRATLNALRPDLNRLAALSKEISCNGYFVFTLDSDDQRILVHGRMFAPAIGISEDPVTGNANGPLGAYLVKHDLLAAPASQVSFCAKQGEAMGRPGLIHVTVQLERGRPARVRLTGRVRVVRCVTLTRPFQSAST
jgi:PhzF family phenazine biosynthesis protein